MVDVAVKFDRFKFEYDYKEFKLLNIVVLVEFKLLILRVELVDSEFKLY